MQVDQETKYRSLSDAGLKRVGKQAQHRLSLCEDGDPNTEVWEAKREAVSNVRILREIFHQRGLDYDGIVCHDGTRAFSNWTVLSPSPRVSRYELAIDRGLSINLTVDHEL